jgi:hypothetical protein
MQCIAVRRGSGWGMMLVLFALSAALCPVPAAAAAEDDLAALSDEFDDPATLAQWQDLRAAEKWPNDQLQTRQVGGETPGALLLVPHTSVWYQDYRGVLQFKPVAGDVMVTADIAVTARSGQGAPRSDFSLAGIMLRAPRNVTPRTWQPGGENYIFLSIGAAQDPGRYVYEVKTTRNSDSQLEIEPGPARATLRAVRIGPHVLLLRKPAGGAWAVHRRYNRPDLPETLQVGITCYTDWTTCSRYQPSEHNRLVIRDGNPDLRAVVDYVRYARPVIPAEWRGRDLSDARQVPDAQVLAALAAE